MDAAPALASGVCANRFLFSTRRFLMSVPRFLAKWLRGGGRRRRMAARQSARPRLCVEALDNRLLLSANYLQTNLVSDLPGLAQLLDPTLKNPWGISLAPSAGAFWVSSNGGGVSELYLGDVNGNPLS